MEEVRMKGKDEREERRENGVREREREREREHGTSVRCGCRQVSGCAHFTLAFANGDTSQRKRERARVSSLLGIKKNEEEPRRRERSEKKEDRAGAREDICPEEKSHQARYTGITLLVRSARGSGEIPGPGPDRRIYREECRTRAHPPMMGRATIYYSRASWHLTCRLVASLFRFSFCRLVDLLVFSLFLSLETRCPGTRFLVGGSQPAATFASAEQSPRTS